MKSNIVLYFGLVLFLFASCRKDETIVEDPMLISTEAPILLEGYTPPYQAVTSSIFGQILNENDEPLEGVRIIVEDHESITDNSGLFSIGDATLNAEGTLIKASVDGYINGSRTIYPDEGGIARIKINLIPKKLTDSYNSVDSALIEVEGGASISFDPNGIVYAGGGAYSGNVNVFAKVLDPTDTRTITEMPGDLSGIRPTDSFSETGLFNFAMLSVELYSDDNRKLQLAEGVPATISIPVPERLLDEAPSTIPLWYFNEDVGKWVEEGVAVLENGVYTGSVTHFTFWICDLPAEITTMCLSFTNETGSPIVGLEVFIKSRMSGVMSDFTDANGVVSGIVPANQELSICTGAIVNGITWSTDLDPIFSKADLSFTLDYTEILDVRPRFSVIPGHMTCGGADVRNTLIKVETNQGLYFYEINQQPFEVFFYHNEDEEIEKLQILDLRNQAVSQEILLFNELGVIWIDDYEVCHPEEEEYLYFHNITGSQWKFLSDIQMTKVEFVSPEVIQIRATTDNSTGGAGSNVFTMNIHAPQGVGDYSGDMTFDGRTFAKANMALGGDSFSWFRGSPHSIRLTRFEENGFIEGEFSGQIQSDPQNVTASSRTVFGRFKVKYEEPELDGSFLDVVINGERQVQTGITGRVDGSIFSADEDSLPNAIDLKLGGTTIGNYANRNEFAHYFNLFNFEIRSTTMDEFEVTQFDDVGGFVKGRFKGESDNPRYIQDDTLYPVEGIFSILHQ